MITWASFNLIFSRTLDAPFLAALNIALSNDRDVAAINALTYISSVIKNPEILHLTPILPSALTEPSAHSKAALDALLECEFMHSIDAASLALLMSIFARALRDHGADLKRKSGAILDNICSMIADPKVLSTHLLQVVLGPKDPIPDVRATAAKVLGNLVKGRGAEELVDLVPWLLTTVKTEGESAERSGAGQGIAKLHSSLPLIRNGLGNESESVREVVLRASKVIVNTHGQQYTDKVLPPLLKHMFKNDMAIVLHFQMLVDLVSQQENLLVSRLVNQQESLQV